MHFSLDLYMLARRGLLPREALVRLAHKHLLDECPRCHEEHAADQGAEEDAPAAVTADDPEASPPRGSAVPPLPVDSRHIGQEDLAARLSSLEQIRHLRDKDRRHLQYLLEVPPERWPEEVESARTRFRSRSFAERLIEESRTRVRRQPQLARRLAALVPIVLHWIPGAGTVPWATELKARARAWEANARRVAGDLEGTQEIFEQVDLARWTQEQSWTGAEIASLLASLRIDQRRCREAKNLIDAAQRTFRQLGDSDALARTIIKQGNLCALLLRPEESLACYQEAADLLKGRAALETVESALLAGRVGSLCDLERYEEAQQLLAPHLPLADIEDAHLRAVLQYNRGRIAIGQQRAEEALVDLVAAQESFLETGRIYDAALVSLDLAYAYLQAGRTADARELARDLVPQFETRGVAREALAALTVLAEAIAAEKLTRRLLARVRRQLTTAPRGRRVATSSGRGGSGPAAC